MTYYYSYQQEQHPYNTTLKPSEIRTNHTGSPVHYGDSEIVSSNYPIIGSLITNSQAITLSQRYGLNQIANQIAKHPEKYRSWYFDGVSGLPDHFLKLIGRGFDITYECALPHDLAYGYGQIGDSHGRRTADREFRKNLVKKGDVSPAVAYICWVAVRVLGSSKLGLSFSWGFADKQRISFSNSPLKITF